MRSILNETSSSDWYEPGDPKGFDLDEYDG